jgi:outer membrane beta-barrel protein
VTTAAWAPPTARAQDFAIDLDALADAPAVPPEPEIVPAPIAPAPVAPMPAAGTPDSAHGAKAAARPAVSTRRVRLEGASENVVRTGPGDAYAIAGVFREGESFRVVAKSGDWYNVQLSATETGWIHASLCKEFDDLSDLEFRPNPKLYTRTGSFVAGAYAGAYAFDRKSNSLVLGGRLGYYLFDRLQAEVGLAWTKVNRPAEIVESLFDLSLEAEKYDMGAYDLGLTFEILPGRQMVPYVTGGAGSAIMQGRSEASYNYGAGTFLFLNKKTLTRWEVRDYRFNSGPPEARQSNNNIAFTFGTSILF